MSSPQPSASHSEQPGQCLLGNDAYTSARQVSHMLFFRQLRVREAPRPYRTCLGLGTDLVHPFRPGPILPLKNSFIGARLCGGP